MTSFRLIHFSLFSRATPIATPTDTPIAIKPMMFIAAPNAAPIAAPRVTLIAIATHRLLTCLAAASFDARDIMKRTINKAIPTIRAMPTIKAMITDFMTVLKGDELNKFLEVYSEEIKDIM